MSNNKRNLREIPTKLPDLVLEVTSGTEIFASEIALSIKQGNLGAYKS
jgi:hypothetical protein